MENPIPYTKEDIYLIVEMFVSFVNQNYGFMINKEVEKYVDYVQNLINCLTPEERENQFVQHFIEFWQVGGKDIE